MHGGECADAQGKILVFMCHHDRERAFEWRTMIGWMEADSGEKTSVDIHESSRALGILVDADDNESRANFNA